LWEFFGTLIFGYGYICSGDDPIYITVSLFAGILIASHRSGGHVNPAVSSAFFILPNNFDWATWIIFMIAQFVGGFLGAALATLL